MGDQIIAAKPNLVLPHGQKGVSLEQMNKKEEACDQYLTAVEKWTKRASKVGYTAYFSRNPADQRAFTEIVNRLNLDNPESEKYSLLENKIIQLCQITNNTL